MMHAATPLLHMAEVTRKSRVPKIQTSTPVMSPANSPNYSLEVNVVDWHCLPAHVGLSAHLADPIESAGTWYNLPLKQVCKGMGACTLVFLMAKSRHM